METAIGKTMREREGNSKADKIIKRGLSYVLTAGTLVDSGLLTSDMSIYCMSIKVGTEKSSYCRRPVMLINVACHAGTVHC
jgi:DNA mismatch repair ATPase MutS